MRLAVLLLLGGVYLSAAAPACQPVREDRIVASDLAAVYPVFGAVPASTLVSLAPVPGARRIFSGPELARLALRFGLKAGLLQPVCFEVPSQLLDPEQAMPVMLASLRQPDARIEIVEMSRALVPEGLLVFPLSSLQRPPAGQPDAPVLWKGYVQYGKFGQKPIWARVRILAPQTRVVARTSLAAGEPIRREQLQVEEYEGFPAEDAPADRESLAGMAPRRTIQAGEAVEPDLLRRVVVVRRGNILDISVQSGAARLQFSGEAETEAAIGETVKVRNPASGRSFFAKVTAPGQAAVNVAAPAKSDLPFAAGLRGIR